MSLRKVYNSIRAIDVYNVAKSDSRLESATHVDIHYEFVSEHCFSSSAFRSGEMSESSFIDDPLAEINRLIDLFVASDSLEESPARSQLELDAVKATGVLPCYLSWFNLLGISGDGHFVTVDVDTDTNLAQREIVESRKIRFVLYIAGQRYPTLRSLRPARPDEAVDCPYCLPMQKLPGKLTCYCGGLGWLLQSELESQQSS